jgi:translation initiation factor 2-alpha kinase 4
VAPRRIEVADWPKALGHETAKELQAMLQRVVAEARGDEVLNDLFTAAKDFLVARAPKGSLGVSLHGSMRTRVEEARLAAQAEAQRDDEQEAREELLSKKGKEEAFLETLNKELADEKRALTKRRTLSFGHEGDRLGDEVSDESGEDEGDAEDAPPRGTTSRYLLEYSVLGKLGEGGGGSVVKARNRLDKRLYALKIINCKKTSKKVLREILTLSRLVHPHIVRYYGAWQEFDDNGPSTNNESIEADESSTSSSSSDRSSDSPSRSSSSSSSDSSNSGLWQKRAPPGSSELQEGSMGDGWDDDDGASRASHFSFSLGDGWQDPPGDAVEDVKTKGLLYM